MAICDGEDLINAIVEDPVGFLTNNVIEAYRSETSGKYNCDLNCTQDGAIISKINNKTGDLYYINLMNPGKGMNKGEIGWLKYEANRTTTLDLYFRTSARLVLTDRLSGCSFGVMKWWTGGIRVAHANLLNDGAIDEARNAQAMVGYRSINKKDYVSGDNSRLGESACIVYGVKTNNGWQFYAQILENYAGGSGNIKEVRRIDA